MDLTASDHRPPYLARQSCLNASGAHSQRLGC